MCELPEYIQSFLDQQIQAADWKGECAVASLMTFPSGNDGITASVAVHEDQLRQEIVNEIVEWCQRKGLAPAINHTLYGELPDQCPDEIHLEVAFLRSNVERVYADPLQARA